ncbi:MAG: ATP-binding protein [Nitrospirota bacterium]
MKKLGTGIFFVALFIFLSVSFFAELHFLRLESVPFFTKFILLLPLNLTILALFILIFFVGKSLAKIYLERKHRVLGYKFKTKLVVILVILTSIPAAFLFIFSSGLITNYIDRWFAPQIRQPLDSSIQIAKAFYDIERQKTLDSAHAFSSGQKLTGDYVVRCLFRMPKDATETIKAAFEGKEGTEIISGEKRDLVRAVIPEYKDGRQVGIIVVEKEIPANIKINAEKIKDSYESYLMLESWKIPIRMNYLLTLGFITLLVVFMALWVALRISRGITDPVQILARATREVAANNFDVQVSLEREDEIGDLVKSFNDMVRELKTGKESVHSAYLYIKNILDNINSGVIMLDTSGNISVINGAACQILNIRREDVTNKNYKELISRINSQELRDLVGSIEGRVFRPFKRQIRAIIGEKQTILLVFITGLKDSQKYIGLLVVFEDITDVLEAQRARTWQDIARKIAHEIKNPLTPIKLSTERMIRKWENKDDNFDEAFHRSARTIIREVDSLKRLVDTFAKFGKMPEITKSPTNIADLVDEVINLYKDYKNIEISMTTPDGLPPVDLDGEQFRRVMVNILDNAFHAMAVKGGRIDISLKYDMPSNRAFVSIADNGPGIKDEDKEKLFQPYFSTKKEGTGLGLAIAHRIISEHEGQIRVGDNIPNGTVFTIELPITES